MFPLPPPRSEHVFQFPKKHRKFPINTLFFHTAANSNSNFILLCIFMNLFCFLYHYSHSDIIRTWCRQPTAPHSKLPDTLGPCLGIFPGRQAAVLDGSTSSCPAPAQLSPSAQPQEVVMLLLVLVLGDARLRLLFSAHIRAALREARNKSSSKWFSGDKFEGRGERGPQSRRYGDWFVIGFPSSSGCFPLPGYCFPAFSTGCTFQFQFMMTTKMALPISMAVAPR